MRIGIECLEAPSLGAREELAWRLMNVGEVSAFILSHIPHILARPIRVPIGIASI